MRGLIALPSNICHERLFFYPYSSSSQYSESRCFVVVDHLKTHKKISANLKHAEGACKGYQHLKIEIYPSFSPFRVYMPLKTLRTPLHLLKTLPLKAGGNKVSFYILRKHQYYQARGNYDT